MDVIEADKIIKKRLKNDFVEFTRHFYDMCNERKLNPDLTYGLIKGSNILEISQQNVEKYGLLFEYESNNYLKITLALTNNETIRIITIFPQDTKRRLK